MRRRHRVLLLATLLALGFFIASHKWQANAATQGSGLSQNNGMYLPGPHFRPMYAGDRQLNRHTPGPVIVPYVRPDFAAEMRALRPDILAAAQRHNNHQLSGMSDHDFAVVIALLMYNEHFGWFEERITPVQALTPFYENLQRETNEAGIANLSVWPANIRPSVALEILLEQVPLPHSTATITVPITVAGSQIDPRSFSSRGELYAAITTEITQPKLAVEYLAANLERGLYRAQLEHVPVLWRTLAAWHNQGIVSPRDIRNNPTADDYIRRSSAYLKVARQLIDTPPPHHAPRNLPPDS